MSNDHVNTADQASSLVIDRLPIGCPIEVRCRFDNSWSNGFVVAGYDGEAYRVCRSGDPTELPVPFARDDVRPIVVEAPRAGRVLWPALQPNRSI